MHLARDNRAVVPSGVVVIKDVPLGAETFDVEIEHAVNGNFMSSYIEFNVVQLAVTAGGSLLVSPNGGGPAVVISPSGYTRARVVKRT